MCGIIAASSNEELDYSAIQLGLLNADDRGGHSCGIAVRGEEPNIIKEVANAKQFINDANDDVKIPRNNKSFIGHTRFATQGDKTIPNTHPFEFGNVTGVHNGSIDNFNKLKNKYIDKYRGDVEYWCGDNWKEVLGVNHRHEVKLESDSRLLYYLIWKYGMEDTLPQLKGTLALVFYREEGEEEYMYFYRYDKPLCYGYKDGQMWIGSMKKYLDSLGCTNIKQVTEHAVYKVKDGKIISAKQKKQALKPKQKSQHKKDDYDEALEPERAEKKSTTTSGNYYGHTNYAHGSGSSRGSDTNQGASCGATQESNDGTDTDTKDRFQFCAPRSAFGDTNEDGDLVLYWFSNNNPDVVYVETQGDKEVDHYDLYIAGERKDLKEDYPVMAERILNDYAELEVVLEYRQKVEQD